MKKPVHVGKKNVTFRFNIVDLVNSFVVLTDITVMINILQDIIEILHEKMLRAKHLYRFHNDASEKTNLLNGHSNEP